MNFNMKNRIWKNLSAMSMAFFMTGMVLGGCGQTTVYAAELAYESVEFEEHSETEETGIEEAGIEESGTGTRRPEIRMKYNQKKIRKKLKLKRGKIPKRRIRRRPICLMVNRKKRIKRPRIKRKHQTLRLA